MAGGEFFVPEIGRKKYMDDLSLGLMLMLIGMVTVFVILLFIIEISKILIKFVNRAAPEEAVRHRQPSQSGDGVEALVRSIILAAVEQTTGGKGRVTGIERV